MRIRTMVILPWAILGVFIIIAIATLAVFATAKIVALGAGVMFWSGWGMCRYRDWVIRKANEISNKTEARP